MTNVPPRDRHVNGFMDFSRVAFQVSWPRRVARSGDGMTHRRYIAAALLWSFVACPAMGHAQAATDPIALQNRAVARIDGFVDYYRRTGDMRSRLQDLAQADVELA